MFKWLLLLCFASLSLPTNGYNILGVFLLPAKSHFFVASALMQGLADAGHNVTMVSPRIHTRPVNYEQIEITGTVDFVSGINFFDMGSLSPTGDTDNLQNIGIQITNHTLNEPNVVALMASGREFDVVIVEIFLSEALIALGRHFKSKSVVGLCTFGASVWTNNLIGNPSPLSFVPHPFLSYTEKMSFWERVGNTLLTSYEMFTMENLYYPRQEQIYNRIFPHINSSFKEVLRNDVGLVLLNTHFTLGYPRPYLPNMIEVGGLNIKRDAQKTVLPEDLQIILDSAKQGVIYFSMGSNIKCKDMAEDKRNALIKAFRKLPHLILWKWEDDHLDGKPENVIIRNWFPQDAILAHPNVKLFITHGGLLSTTESIYFGKPVLGIAVFGDQALNMKRAAKAGYGVQIDYKNVTEEGISWALDKILNSYE